MINGLGQRLTQLRENLKLTQKEVAKSLGTSASIISNYESDGRVPSVENLLALSRLYHCSTDYLLGLDKNRLSVIDSSMLNKEQVVLLQQFLKTLG